LCPVLPVISGLGDGNVTGVSKTNEDCSQMAIGETLRSGSEIGTTAPVMSVAEDESAPDVSKTNSATKAESIFEITKGEIISGGSIANRTNVSELELPVDIAATGDLVGKIAFASDRDGDFEIYVMDADGSNVKKLTSNSTGDSYPDWCFPTEPTITVSPSTVTLDVGDTQQFTATTKDQNGNPMAGIIITWTSSNTAVGTVSPASVTTGSDGKATTAFTASASGTTTIKAAHENVSGTASVNVKKKGDSVCKIVFTSNRDGNGEIYVMNVDGINVKKLTSNTAGDWSPDASPDGSKIAFVSDRDGDAEIYVMDADGTNVKKLTSNTAWDYTPDWSPDGSKIAFDSDRDGYGDIYAEI